MNEPEDQAFLLRLWRSRSEQGAEWRMRLTDLATAESRGFGRLPDLMEYLVTRFWDPTEPLDGETACGQSGFRGSQ